VPPRGSQGFSASGGSGTGWAWSLSASPSGGSINPSTGAYTAGTTGSVTDVVQVTDSLGNVASRSVAVTAGVAIAGASCALPAGAIGFTASGGSGTGWAWSLSDSPSGGSIDPSTGAYTAGATTGVTDVVQVADSLGNGATANVAVSATCPASAPPEVTLVAADPFGDGTPVASLSASGDAVLVGPGRDGSLVRIDPPAAATPAAALASRADAERRVGGEQPALAGLASGDWAAPLLAQLGHETKEAATVLVATPDWLFVGFDDAATGLQVYRAAVAPREPGDLLGRGGCAAGSVGCEGLGGNGFGDREVSRVFDARALTVGGATSLWITGGDGVGPVRVYRVESAPRGAAAAGSEPSAARRAATQEVGCSSGGSGASALLAALALARLRRRRSPGVPPSRAPPSP
jgi:uncharacterized protein (TIGR03382 family)